MSQLHTNVAGCLYLPVTTHLHTTCCRQNSSYVTMSMIVRTVPCTYCRICGYTCMNPVSHTYTRYPVTQSSVVVVRTSVCVCHTDGSVTTVVGLISVHNTVCSLPPSLCPSVGLTVWVRRDHMTNVVPATFTQLPCACPCVCYHGNMKTRPLVAAFTSQQGTTTTTPEHPCTQENVSAQQGTVCFEGIHVDHRWRYGSTEDCQKDAQACGGTRVKAMFVLREFSPVPVTP